MLPTRSKLVGIILDVKFFTAETSKSAENFLATDFTAFTLLAFFGKVFFTKQASSKYHYLAREGLWPS
jgi:hypothetical protein